MCLTDRFEKAGLDLQLSLTPYKLQNESADSSSSGDGSDEINFNNLTVDKSVSGQFETVVSQGTMTSSPRMEAKIGLLKVGVEIADKVNPSLKDK